MLFSAQRCGNLGRDLHVEALFSNSSNMSRTVEGNFPGGGGGDSYMEGAGILVGNFEKNP